MNARRDLWGSRFREKPSAALSRLNDSLSFDRVLLAEDVEGSIAWARSLGRAGVLKPVEVRALTRALEAVGAGTPPSDGHEDVHSFVEARLAPRVGALAGKLHTGRSRNDQVALDLRLYLRKAFAEAKAGALGIADALARRASEEAGTPMPGYTHGRRAEPITFGHWCLAYVEMLLRDASRLGAAAALSDECPLGAGALSGSPVPIDRRALAKSLGFARPAANSLDAVSDRDSAADYLYSGALLLSHLSRLAGDVLFFSSDEIRFLSLPDRLSTGSSRMPHKKNPDLLELLRGHAARAAGDVAGFLAVLKGLPLAYNKDLQLDKEPVFRLRATLAAALPAAAELVLGLALDRPRMQAAAADARFLATELADALAARGVPFRRAHAIVGRRVARAERAGTTIRELGPSTDVSPADLAAMDIGRALARRSTFGGTAPRNVARAAAAARRRIAALCAGKET
ncbi:MAG: argininosuccinate lyase [Thermoanaerobaculia bacterium]